MLRMVFSAVIMYFFSRPTSQYVRDNYSVLSNMAHVYHIVVIRVIWISWAHVWRLRFRFLETGCDKQPWRIYSGISEHHWGHRGRRSVEGQLSTHGIDRRDQIMTHQFTWRIYHFVGPAMCHVHWELLGHVRASIYSRDPKDHQTEAWWDSLRLCETFL
jgi:hypothetical protein